MPGSTPSRLRSCTLPVAPMSERQQLKLVRQMETGDTKVPGNTTPTREPAPHRPRSKSCNGRGETPLHKAAIRGDEELVVKLLEDGADPNIADFAGWTPLHEACNHGWYDVAVALVQAGASVNARGFDDDTPLHDAAINGHCKLVQLLVDRGADVFIRNKGGKTPCDVAAPGLMPHLLKSQNVELGTGRRSYKSESDVSVSCVSSRSAHSDEPALCEMRRTPPHSKVDKSPRVTLRLHPLKKKTGKPNSEGAGKGVSPAAMEEKTSKEDVYEFKSSKEATPVRGNSTSPDVNSSEMNDKTEGESPSGKRSIADVTDKEENEEDSKKKKRKEGEGVKEGTVPCKPPSSASRLAAVRNVNTSTEKGCKFGHVIGKSVPGMAAKTGLPGCSASGGTDRKSPSSPKGSTSVVSSSSSSSTKADEVEDKAGADGEKAGPGPKVPPLKIVIPQQGASEPEQGNRNGKHHQALPYVVSSNSNDSEKDGSVSPTDSLKSDEKKDPAIGMLSAEDQKGGPHHQRVLRSHRGGPGTGDERPGSAVRNGANGPPAAGQGTATGASGPQSASTASANNASGGAATAIGEATSPSNQNPSPTASQAEKSDRVGSANGNNSESTVAVSTASSTASTNYGSCRSTPTAPAKTPAVTSNPPTSTTDEKPKTEEVAESSSTPPTPPQPPPAPVELHPRKRKLKHTKEVKEAKETPAAPQGPEPSEPASATTDIHPQEQPVKNCYQLFLDIRKQIERRRKGLFPVQPKPPQGFKDYLLNRCTYVLASNASTRQIPSSPIPQNLANQAIKDHFTEQEKERHRLRLHHIIEKEKLVLSVEQEILRVHGRAARALANQSLPFSVCTILKDEEVYNLITPEQEEKDRNARSRYNGRLFLSWLQDVDDKWEKIKESMLLRHHNEAESLYAVQKMDWEWKMKELGLCEFKSKPVILETHVPMVNITDDFDLLPA